METKGKRPTLKLWQALLLLLWGILLGFVIGASIFNTEPKNFDKGYKQGQIDCLNGIQNYEMSKDTIYIKKQ